LFHICLLILVLLWKCIQFALKRQMQMEKAARIRELRKQQQ
jgi:hypothetical protein